MVIYHGQIPNKVIKKKQTLQNNDNKKKPAKWGERWKCISNMTSTDLILYLYVLLVLSKWILSPLYNLYE